MAFRKIALVTGANKGIGFEVARQLAETGATVLLGARDPDRGEQAAQTLRGHGGDVRFILLDLGRADSIQEAAAKIEAEFGRLDILINNAGVFEFDGEGAPSVARLDVVERTLRTNFIGALAVTQAMLPLLRKSSAARIVNVSSGLGSLTQHADRNWQFADAKVLGYSASKAALNMLTVQLAYELRDSAIKVNSADPGYTATDLNGNRGTQTVAEGSEAILRLALLPDDGPSASFFDRNGPVPW